jgi:hypothetical protein
VDGYITSSVKTANQGGIEMLKKPTEQLLQVTGIVLLVSAFAVGAGVLTMER